MARQSARTLLPLLAAAAATYWGLSHAAAFCGVSGTARAPGVQRDGWRLDMMEVGPSGIGKLVIHEGYWIGEKGFTEAQSKNGRRYRLRATSEELKKGLEDVPLTQIGPLKLRLGEVFGGSGQKPGLKRPEGYRGIAGAAGWDTDIPTKGKGFDVPAQKMLS